MQDVQGNDVLDGREKIKLMFATFMVKLGFDIVLPRVDVC